MIEMIFLMSVFAEIFTTTGGGPGNESTNVAFLIFKQALMNFDVGVASAVGAVRGGAGQHRRGIPDPHDRQEPRLSARHEEARPRDPTTVAAWGITLLIVSPLIWLVLTAFKTEQQAISVPPQIFFTPTLESFAEVNLRSDLLFAKNSVISQRGLDAARLGLAAPAAYSMAFFRTKKRDQG